MNKKQIRKDFLAMRKALRRAERAKLDDLLLIQFQRFSFGNIETLFTYFPVEETAEPNTFLYTEYLKFRFPELKVAYPITDLSSREMKAGIVTDETEYDINSYGLTEPVTEHIAAPEDIDVIFVPLLAFDLQGYRVGYGKGYYDNFLAKCDEDTLKIGFCYFEPLQEIEDVNQWDIPLNYCITPSCLYAFE